MCGAIFCHITNLVCVISQGHLGSVGREGGGDGGGGGGGGGIKKVLENLPELSDAKQYTDEYDLTGFMKSLKKI